MTYYINYNTGAGNCYVIGTLEDAMKEADEGTCYTQEPITIEDEDGNEIARRQWWGVTYAPGETEETEDEVIQFGSFGYYGAWNLFC